MHKLKSSILENPFLVLIVLYAIGKMTFYYKVGFSYLEFLDTENDFFPSFFKYINPFYLDWASLALLLVGKRWAYILCALIHAALIVHPLGFGMQHYVMSFYMFLWLSFKDSKDHSIFFGRVILSFLYLAATIGKLTPGWIDGTHYGSGLPWLSQNPVLIIGGEFLFGIAFLLPFYLGVLIPVAIVAGMIYSISFLILDAVGPILGMVLTMVAIKETKEDSIRVEFASNSVRGLIAYKFLSLLDSKRIQLLPIKSPQTVVYNQDNEALCSGYRAYCEVVARIPAIAFLYPFLTGKVLTNILSYR